MAATHVNAVAEPTSDWPKAVLVGVDFGGAGYFDATLDELALLAESAGDLPVARLVARRKAPDAALFVGSGKADEIKALVEQHQAEAVLFDQALSPAQQRNLERHLGVAVADRTMLILEIFAARAKSHEGKLQVELARLQYLSTRLVRRWTHLERQRGGVGHRGGPGEAQIELDRRMIGERIKAVKQRLEKVKKQRGTQRRARSRSGTWRVSLVGYTNAGKSTLFNALVHAGAYAADQLFATLDTTTREFYLKDIADHVHAYGHELVQDPAQDPAQDPVQDPAQDPARDPGQEHQDLPDEGRPPAGAYRSVSLSDTVGFIRDLPHKLVEAFEATLQEAADADLLVHVVDASSPLMAEQMAEVDRVLTDIGAADVPRLLVYNKLDLLEATQVPHTLSDVQDLGGGARVHRVFVSAVDGRGLDLLRSAIAHALMHPGDDAGAASSATSTAIGHGEPLNDSVSPRDSIAEVAPERPATEPFHHQA